MFKRSCWCVLSQRPCLTIISTKRGGLKKGVTFALYWFVRVTRVSSKDVT